MVSLIQTQAVAIIALFSLAAGLQQRNDESILAQRPFHGAAGSIGNKETLRKDATIELYPAAFTEAMKVNARSNCKGLGFKTIYLPTDTCLYDSSYPNKNIKIAEEPVCPDGSAPFLQYYQTRTCRGEAQATILLETRSILNACLWGGLAPKDWSMIFRCGQDRELAKEREMSLWARSPQARRHTKPLETPSDAVMISHASPGCIGQKFSGDIPYTLRADKMCVTTPGYGIQIQKPAVCANGTRAKWARYEDAKCGQGHFPSKYGLMEIKDSDIGKCLSTGPINSPTKVRSIAFWCDGLPPQDTKPEDPNAEEPKTEDPKIEDSRPASQAAPGSVSESACKPGKAPFFNHPKTDTCVNFQLPSSSLKIYSSGICANGTKALMAAFSPENCASTPHSLFALDPEDLEVCLPFQGMRSFAFWCTGNIEAPSAKVTHTNATKDGTVVIWALLGGILGALVLVSGGLYLALYTNVGSKIKSLFVKDGAIAL